MPHKLERRSISNSISESLPSTPRHARTSGSDGTHEMHARIDAFPTRSLGHGTHEMHARIDAFPTRSLGHGTHEMHARCHTNLSGAPSRTRSRDLFPVLRAMHELPPHPHAVHRMLVKASKTNAKCLSGAPSRTRPRNLCCRSWAGHGTQEVCARTGNSPSRWGAAAQAA